MSQNRSAAIRRVTDELVLWEALQDVAFSEVVAIARSVVEAVYAEDAV